MSNPDSPRSASDPTLAPPVASSSKPRRTVRVFGLPEDSSSDEEGALGEGALDADGKPRHPRQSSYPGPSSITSPPPRSVISSIPKLHRSITSTSGGLPAHSSDTDWRTRSRIQRNGSLRGPGAAGKLRARNDDAYSRALRGGAGGGGGGPVDMNDPDANYFHAHSGGRLHHLDDSGSDDDLDGPSGASPANGMGSNHTPTNEGGDSPAILPGMVNKGAGSQSLPDAAESRERLEWQSMLRSVLKGDVLQEESTRIGEEKPGDGHFRRELGRSFWWQIRARLRGRSADEERRRVEERRQRVVDQVLEEVEGFVVKQSPGPAGVGRRLSAEDSEAVEEAELAAAEGQLSEIAALDQVAFILGKLELVQALYPHERAFKAAKTLYDTPSFQSRVDALQSWYTIVTALQGQLHILQKWTGSDDLDVTRPNTTKEKALVGKSRYHPLDNKRSQASNDQAADDSTFLERIMKEDLQQIFKRRVFIDLHIIIRSAKRTVIDHSPIFEELKLPDFQYELVRLIGFPGSLIIEALKLRLDAANKLVDPNPFVISDMIDNFRGGIRLAVELKRKYEDMVRPDPDERWKIPPCLAPNYDSVILDALRTFFKLLHWKLKSGSRAIYFRETEVLEDEWEFLYDVAEAVKGGDLVVAEHFCSLTNKLMVRVCNYFETQLHVPVPINDNAATLNKSIAALRKQHPDPDGVSKEQRQMAPEEMLVWYSKILDAVRMRYRKLQRFARRLTQRFDNSAEYALEDEDLDALIQQLQDSGHFLVYTHVFEERGTYIMADESLWNNPTAVAQLLSRAFSSTVQVRRRAQDHIDPLEETVPEVNIVSSAGEESDDDEDIAGYLLLLSPRQNFAWTGAVMTLDLPYTEFALEDNRIRLIADGPTSRLELCKRLFAEALVNPDTGEPALVIQCLVEQQAHLPRIQRELRKISRSNYHLTESFIESAAHVRRAFRSAPGTEDMIENWYVFASEHGKRAMNHVDFASYARFIRLLMRLGISWVSFICDSCDPTDRKTFRWTVAALRFVFLMTEGQNILHLEAGEFDLLRKSVASLVSLLISHFDILGARGSMEAKKEAEKVEAIRRLQRLHENIDDDFMPHTPSPDDVPGIFKKFPADRSIRFVREERLRLIAELEEARIGVSSDQHMIGQVLDEEVSEDRSLVFLAASSSNIALRWQQGQYIGGGANGNVYMGFNLDSGGIMAVKEIRVQDMSTSSQLFKAIKDESDVMGMLTHPNIVEYYGIEVHRDRVFIFQEYCEGGSLANLLSHGRIEDEELIILYTLQMLDGLAYLHEKKIEHRDVKPENILLGSGGALKFVDFGAAKVVKQNNRTVAAKTRAVKHTPGPAGMAGMESFAGTPMYMAPEVIKTATQPGQLGAADIWSLGCVVGEISTGRKPWNNLDNEWAIMFRIGMGNDTPPLPEPGELSDQGIAFIDQCLNVAPSKRPTARELLNDPWVEPMRAQVDEYERSQAQQQHSNSSYPQQNTSVAADATVDGSGGVSVGLPSMSSTHADPFDPAQHAVIPIAAQLAQELVKDSDATQGRMPSFESTPGETPGLTPPESVGIIE